ncbi:hypothetical protein SASPL_131978 [Salvia splendens]|uniref:Protein kinase domain-containing protein n=1 Tax=Salvia splendens TaxID=180675 RepID=A0A8X8XB22_SALSN|nr:hypothetical protein SASPL_131978 [Salvia splendens]
MITSIHLHLHLHLLLLLSLLPASSPLNLDGTLLLSLKYSIISDPLSLLYNWHYNDATPCLWTCVDNLGLPDFYRVTSLTLSNASIAGNIPEDLGFIPHLKTLDLSGNFFSSALPRSLFNASRLRVLDLSGNAFSGSIPAIADVAAISFLNLSDDKLSGNVPLMSPNLTVVSLRRNYLSDEIPAGIRSVQVFDISSNLINGSLPAGVSDILISRRIGSPEVFRRTSRRGFRPMPRLTSRKIGSSPYHLPFMTWLNIVKGVARGLTYIHDKKNVHGNIKPSNILLTADMEPVISDFGLHGLIYGKQAQKFDGPVQHLGSRRSTTLQIDPHETRSPYMGPAVFAGCTSPYHAPESLNNLKPHPKWDVYSFGILLLELLTGKVFSDRDLRMADMAIRGDVAAHEEGMVAWFKLGFSCASLVPQKRPCMRDALHVLEKYPCGVK